VIGDSAVMSGHFNDNSAYCATRLAMLQDPSRRSADAEAVARALQEAKEAQQRAMAVAVTGANGKHGNKGGGSASGLTSGNRVDWKFQWNSKNSFTPQGSRPGSGGNDAEMDAIDMLGPSSSSAAAAAAAATDMRTGEENSQSGVAGSSNGVNEVGAGEGGDFSIEEQRKLDFDRTSYAVYNDNDDDDNSFGSMFGPPTVPWEGAEDEGENGEDELTVSDSLNDDDGSKGGDISLHSWTAGEDLLTEAGLALHDQLISNSAASPLAIGGDGGKEFKLPFSPSHLHSPPYGDDGNGNVAALQEAPLEDLQDGSGAETADRGEGGGSEAGGGAASGDAKDAAGGSEAGLAPRGRTQSQHTGRRRRMVSPGGVTGEAQALRPSEHAVVNVEGTPLLCTLVPEEFRDDESVKL